MIKGTRFDLTPIETQFLLSCLTNASDGYQETAIGYKMSNYGHEVDIIPQHKIDKYRVDFLFIVDRKKQFIVECDGHDFHEKTKEQVIKDNIRDRYFLMRDIPVFRFSGSEIFNSSDHLAYEILITYIALRSQ